MRKSDLLYVEAFYFGEDKPFLVASTGGLVYNSTSLLDWLKDGMPTNCGFVIKTQETKWEIL